ncbi:MAG: exodeoxyribonuclease V subunit alpha [Endozoicomonas sp.]
MSRAEPLLKSLRQLSDDRQIRPLDYQFARFISELDDTPHLVLASALVSFELGQGNVCLELTSIDADNLFDLDSNGSKKLLEHAEISHSDWSEPLRRCLPVGSLPESQTKPLVLDKNRLYLYRYWLHECHVAERLSRSSAIGVDEASARTILDRLFQRDYGFLHRLIDRTDTKEAIRKSLEKWLDVEHPEKVCWEDAIQCVRQAEQASGLEELNNLVPYDICLNWQKVAAALAVTQTFSVISGGPGTGKTTTVTRLLAMLVELGLTQGRVPTIRLVAPTGKASARLTESIGGALANLNCSEAVKQLIPAEAGTIHRLLGVIPNQPGYRHNADNRLHLDILVVDEASMVDLPMMNHLLSALPDQARVILLGDRDQLASVEAGSVLGDICAAADEGYSREQTARLEKLTGFRLETSHAGDRTTIGDSFCLLKKSYRFDALSGIGKLATAVNQGKPEAVSQIWQHGYEDIRQHPCDKNGYVNLLKLCIKGYRPYLEAIRSGASTIDDKRRILSAYNCFRLLCALREGRYGVAGLNDEIRQSLARSGLVPAEGLWYEGRPVLITQNDHSLGLYNGDIGITLAGDDGRFRVIFELPDGAIKQLLPSRLPQHETVYAMTVHKSQGSEFTHTAMVLPETMNPVLTRELVYTGITRAREKLDMFASEEILAGAIRNPTRRSSGLQQRLLNP